jgi:hypothetical protein
MPRASWRGYLRLSLVSCPIYLSPATARTKPIRLHQVWRAAPDEGDGDLEDQVGREDVSERPASRLTPDYVEDQAERARPAARWSIVMSPRHTVGGQRGVVLPHDLVRGRSREPLPVGIDLLQEPVAKRDDLR